MALNQHPRKKRISIKSFKNLRAIVLDKGNTGHILAQLTATLEKPKRIWKNQGI